MSGKCSCLKVQFSLLQIENYLNCCLTLLMKEKKTLMKEYFEHFAFAFLYMFKDGVLHDSEFFHCFIIAALPNSKGGCFPSQDVGTFS